MRYDANNRGRSPAPLTPIFHTSYLIPHPLSLVRPRLPKELLLAGAGGARGLFRVGEVGLFGAGGLQFRGDAQFELLAGGDLLSGDPQAVGFQAGPADHGAEEQEDPEGRFRFYSR